MNIDLGTTMIADDDEAMKATIEKVFIELDEVKHAFLASINKHNEDFDRFISPGKSFDSHHFPFVSILRKWNSYTPVLPNSNNHTKGGGYFVFFNGIGLVIDPGYNFIQNFLSQNFKLDDIDAVAITHAHNDHTVELESILSLLYKRNKKYKDNLHKIDLYLNLGSFKKFSSFFDLSIAGYPNYINNIIALDSYNVYSVLKDDNDSNFKLYTTKAQHHEMITSTYALGFVLRCGDTIIKFTGDTGWNATIEQKNKDFLEDNSIDKIDILIPHIGSIKEHEFLFDFKKTIKQNFESTEIFYDQHLGILGCICMIDFYKAEIVIFSEFGEELKSIRKQFVEKISKALNIKALPGDIGLYINIENLKVFCLKSGEFESIDDIEIFNRGSDLDLIYVSKNSFADYELADKNNCVQTIELKKIV